MDNDNGLLMPGDPDFRLPKEIKEPGKVHRILRVRMSVQLIYFIKTRKVIPVAGFIIEKDMWMAALLHFETQKVLVSTQAVFKTKKQALEFAEQLVDEARNTKLQ